MNRVEKAIKLAIMAPETYAPRMLNIETVTEWQTRAVMYALRSIGVLSRPRAIQRHLVTSVMQCPVCSPRSWIKNRRQLGTNLVDAHWECQR